MKPLMLVLLLLLAGCSSGTESLADYKCPDCNVVIITIDTLRADNLGCYGYGRNTAPFICSLQAARFENAYAPSPNTMSSHSSLFSGLYAENHSAYLITSILDNRIVLLPEILKKANYSTYGIANVGWLEESNIGQGLDEFIVISDSGKKLTADNITQFARDVISSNDRFYLWLHYFQVHEPYEAYGKHHDMFLDFQSPRIGINHMEELAKIKYVPGLGEKERQYLISQYDGNIRYVDEQVEQVFSALDEKDILNKTIVIITSDHGELLGEKVVDGDFLFGHFEFLEPLVLKIPLIMHLPNQGLKTFSKLASLVDIPPTLLNLLNINTDLTFDGVDLFSAEHEFVHATSHGGDTNILNINEIHIISFLKRDFGYQGWGVFAIIMNPEMKSPESYGQAGAAICITEDCSLLAKTYGDLPQAMVDDILNRTYYDCDSEVPEAMMRIKFKDQCLVTDSRGRPNKAIMNKLRALIGDGVFIQYSVNQSLIYLENRPGISDGVALNYLDIKAKRQHGEQKDEEILKQLRAMGYLQ
jgi:arylsulfatase A-like enzyme